MLEGSRITFVGPGVMAEAMLIGLVNKAGVPADQVTLSGPREKRLQDLAEKYTVATALNNREAAAKANIVVISVKPQSLAAVLKDLQGGVPPGALVLSIVAGARLGTLAGGLDHPAVVRSMPNTPARVGEGITVWTASAAVDDDQRQQAKTILGALGQEIFVEDENYLDMATALSGTGPSYVYLFMEAMVDAGVHLGFPRRIAEQLVVQTVKGSVAYYEHSPRHLARLRNEVTSPGGTSAAALYYLEKAGLRTALSRAIWAAYERSSALGRSDKPGHLDDA